MAKKEEKEDLWVVKVRRAGGYSIIDISSKEKAEELAAEFNFQYQTDNYFVEEYKPSDEYGYIKEKDANPDHGKP